MISWSRDHPEATQQMNDLIIAKVSAALKGHWANPDLVGRLACLEAKKCNNNVFYVSNTS